LHPANACLIINLAYTGVFFTATLLIVRQSVKALVLAHTDAGTILYFFLSPTHLQLLKV
jgi:hypothetical protein